MDLIGGPQWADLIGAHLGGADLSVTNLDGANLTEADLTRSAYWFKPI